MKVTGAILLGGAVAVAGACGSSEPGDGDGDAFLSIVGQQNVYLEHGAQVELEVRYHDSSDVPLQGVVEYEIDGDTGGAQMASTSATTNNDGIASVTLEATNESQAQFFVNASAPDAGSVTWNITVEEPQGPLEPNGTYDVESSLDLVSGLEEGTVKTVVDSLIQLTSDPAQFLFDTLVNICESQLDSYVDCSLVSENELAIVLAINLAIEEFAPDSIKDFLEQGENFADVLQDFGLVSELTIEGSGATRDAEHILSGVQIRFGDDEFSRNMSELGMDAEEVSLSVEYDENANQITLLDHGVPFSYGELIKLALERGLIANISDEDNLADFLKESLIDCATVGKWIDEETPISESIGVQICNAGVDYVADTLILGNIEEIDNNAVELVISGTADLVSTNSDENADVLRDGRWTGTIEYPGSVMTNLEALANTFEGHRSSD